MLATSRSTSLQVDSDCFDARRFQYSQGLPFRPEFALPKCILLEKGPGFPDNLLGNLRVLVCMSEAFQNGIILFVLDWLRVDELIRGRYDLRPTTAY